MTSNFISIWVNSVNFLDMTSITIGSPIITYYLFFLNSEVFMNFQSSHTFSKQKNDSSEV